MKDLSQAGPVDWLRFKDPDTDELLAVNLSFLASNWKCRFGIGCPGMLSNNASYRVPDLGCCEIGFYATNSDEKKVIDKRVEQLTSEDWDDELREVYEEHGDWSVKDGKKSRIVKGGCIFANRADGSVGKTGKYGCAFLHMGNRLNEGAHDITDNSVEHVQYMPNVCSMLPLYVTWDGDGVKTLTSWSNSRWFRSEEPDLRAHLWWCVSEGTLVTTERGLVPIEQVSEDDRVLTRAGFRQVLARHDNGERPVVKIVHEGGTLIVTEDHKLLTTRGWLRGSEVIAGTAHTVATVGSDVGVLRRVLMPVGAELAPAGAERLASPDVLVARQTVEMLDVHAQPVPAQMVEFPSFGDASHERAPKMHSDVAGDAVTFCHGITTANPFTTEGDALVGLDHILVDEVVQPVSHVYTIYQVVNDHQVARVYDLTVEGQHEYVAGGVVVHNCVDDKDSYINSRPLYITMEQEIRKLIGDRCYEVVRQAIEAKNGTIMPYPASPEGRKQLKLLGLPDIVDETVQNKTGHLPVRRPLP